MSSETQRGQNRWDLNEHASEAERISPIIFSGPFATEKF